jgi:hypothetical protein
LTLASSTPVPSVLSPVFDVEFDALLDGHNKTFVIRSLVAPAQTRSGEQLRNALPWWQ